ncbi:helix-turn-helix domain-containing protein [Bacillus haikouensis]|uniref:helix-turn-helix domain-containing protein n=1 Tax=Bacillus haikouensis TaxID=1510468 RepID=UPI001557F2F6|nr:helix-turn-helix domain-containing protein [Bacillus haikouensis]NQD64964.1 helix-turn-helix domain-containing protein [Bacillus haikouensis]
MTELGKRLKEAREAKGYSLDDLQRITKIQKRYLIGIEEGNYDMMPGKFYVRAFIKQYCEAVGLQPEAVFEEYKEEIPTTYEDEIPVSLSRVQTRKGVPASSSKVFDVIPRILIALFVIGALIALWVFVQHKVSDDAGNADNSNKEPVAVDQQDLPDEEEPVKDNDKQQKDDSATEKSEEEKKDKEENSGQSLKAVETEGTRTTYELKNTDQFKLELAAKGDAWVAVYNSKDEVLFEGMLYDGDKKEFDLSSDQQAFLIIGNAANTAINVNGKLLEYKIPVETVRQDVIIQYKPAESQQ